MGELADLVEVIPGIFKRPDGLYGFRANVPGGKGAQTKVQPFPSQDAAYRARILYLAGTQVKAMDTVAGWFDEFLEIKARTVRLTTIAGYRYALGLLRPHIGDLLLADLDETSLEKAYGELIAEYGTETIKTAHWRIRTALRLAVRRRKLSWCVADNVLPPRGLPSRERAVWTFEELLQFLKFTSEQRDATMWAFWVTTGLRRGEVCGLEWSKFDFADELVRINWQRTITCEGLIVEGPVKTDDGEREIPLDSRVVSALRGWRARQSELRLAAGDKWQGREFVFTSVRNRPYYPDSFNDRLDYLCEKAGLRRLTPHELRHTYATRAVEDGMEITLLSKLLGHSRTDTTRNLYVHPNTDQKRAANTALANRMFGG